MIEFATILLSALKSAEGVEICKRPILEHMWRSSHFWCAVQNGHFATTVLLLFFASFWASLLDQRLGHRVLSSN